MLDVKVNGNHIARATTEKEANLALAELGYTKEEIDEIVRYEISRRGTT